jgi:signal transduction histidine kinase
MENAAKYSPKDSEIKVTAQTEHEHLIIRVSDQGIGISPEEKAKLFRPFERLNELRVAGTVGTGLGLTVCERLIEAHGGRIWVESEPGQGSTFFFTLPYEELREIC